MELNTRQSEILARARASGKVMVDDLAQLFGVTTQTVRRDLNELCNKGHLARIHGGAILATSVFNIGYSERRQIASEEKQAIGRSVAEMIPDGCSMFLNIGTTIEQVAAALTNKRDLVIVTNNINIIRILGTTPDIQVILTGGLVRQSDGAIVGDDAVDYIRKFKVDYAVIGASALDDDGSITDFDIREVAVSRAIVANSREVILACDSTKFERNAPVRICHIADIDTFVTDRPPPHAFAKACKCEGVRVVTAEGLAVQEASDD